MLPLGRCDEEAATQFRRRSHSRALPQDAHAASPATSAASPPLREDLPLFRAQSGFAGGDEMSAASEKSFEARIADLVRRLGTDFEGEAVATWTCAEAPPGVVRRHLHRSRQCDREIATGGLAEAEMKRLFNAGYQKGVEDTERKRIAQETALGLKPDGSHRLGSHCALLPAAEGAPRGQAPPVRRRHGVAHDVGPRADREAGQVPAQHLSPARREDDMTVAPNIADEDTVRRVPRDHQRACSRTGQGQRQAGRAAAVHIEPGRREAGSAPVSARRRRRHG